MRGIHRRVLAVLLGGVLLGAAAGWAVHGATTGGHGLVAVGLAILLVLLLWPLGWIATFGIARPLTQLARVAGALREGELSRRTELPERDDEVGEVAGALNAMAGRISGQLEDQRALLAAVSHELRSPLARLRVLVELAREGRGPDDLHDDLQTEIDGMDALVGDLLAASRIDFEAVQPDELDPTALARRALELTGIDEAVLNVRSTRAIRADATLLVRALRGMLDNAVRYGDEVQALRIDVRDGEVQFMVEDAGPGFEDGEETQVFQPFWRRPPDAGEPSGGVGLGLALVSRIAEAHEGRAWATNREGGGARVVLAVPHVE